MVKCPICGKRVIPRTEPKPARRGMYAVEPMNLYPNPYDNIVDNQAERETTYHCIDPKCYGEISEDEYDSRKEFEQLMVKPTKLPRIGDYDFFISYYSGTGATFAKYLKEHSKDIGNLNAFLDIENIPKKITNDTNEWRSYIDQAIENSKIFLLIMTRRFNERREVIREYWKAKDCKIPMLLFKQKTLDAEDLCSDIGSEPIDFSNLEYTEFTDECDLLTKVDEIINAKRKGKGAKVRKIRGWDISEKVIEPLYSEVKSNIKRLYNYNATLSDKYDSVIDSFWYDQIAPLDRQKIDEFYNRLKKYTLILCEVRKLTTRMIHEELCRVKPDLKVGMQQHSGEGNFEINLSLKDTSGNTRTQKGFYINDALMEKKSFKKYLQSLVPLEKIIDIMPIILAPRYKLSKSELRDFEEGLKIRVKQDKTYLLMWQERSELLNMGKIILRDMKT